MNKKGFTLIELMGVIVIIGLLIILAIPSITNLLNDEEENISSAMEKVLLQAGELYTQDNIGIYPKTEGNVYCVTLKELVDEEYLGSPIKDPVSSNEIDQNKYIKTSIQNGTYNYEITDSCEDITQQIPVIPDEYEISGYKCVRAKKLRTEECTQTSNGCYAAGYVEGNKGTIITYGNLGTKGTLTSGDAFDCDVNGDGVTGINERFYYVSDLYNTTSKEFDSNYAVLIYYNNTTLGVADSTSSSLIAYDANNKNYNGPVTAIINLPTTTQWSNVSLSNISRTIITQYGTASTYGGTLPTSFSYTKEVDGVSVPLAARLLTVQEVNSACGINVSDSSMGATGELDTCNYLMENTKYSNSLITIGPWLETPRESYKERVWEINGYSRSVNSTIGTDNNLNNGARPVIEVLKTDIDY